MSVIVVDPRAPSALAIQETATRLGVKAVVSSDPEATHAGAVVIVDLDTITEAGGAPSVPALEIVAQFAKRGIAPVVIGSGIALAQVEPFFLAGARDVLAAPVHSRELLMRLDAVVWQKHRVACLGGGTGLYTVLSALKDVPDVLLSSIVSMSDDGGSSGRLRATFGVLPPGDVRRSLVALSNAPEVMSYVMQYRFQGGDDLSGHSLGNLLLAALAERTGSMQDAVKSLGDVLNVQGHVMCVTDRATTLCAEFEDGRVVKGESAIDRCAERPHALRVRRVWHEPAAESSVDVLATLYAADLIVIGPGDMITSVMAGLLIDGIADAVRRSPARRLYVCNLMTKPGETDGFDAAEHVTSVNGALGGDVLDIVLVSSSRLDPAAVHSYSELNQQPVELSPEPRMRAVTRAEIQERDIGDRSKLVRHDAVRLRDTIVKVLHRQRPSAEAGE